MSLPLRPQHVRHQGASLRFRRGGPSNLFQKPKQILYIADDSEKQEMSYKMPIEVLTLRLCIDIFKALSHRRAQVSITSILKYVNQKEYYPLTIAQTLSVFQMDSTAKQFDVSEFIARFYYKIMEILKDKDVLGLDIFNFRKDQERTQNQEIDQHSIEESSNEEESSEDSESSYSIYAKSQTRHLNTSMIQENNTQRKCKSAQKTEDCNLTDVNEEKISPKKAFLSVANILAHIKNDSKVVKQKKRQSKDLVQVVSEKVDQKLLKQHFLRCRGFLVRKSMRFNKKHTYCFYYLDINRFVMERVKLLVSYRPLKKLIDRDISNQQDFKRFKLQDNSHVFLLYSVIQGIQSYYCLRYSREDTTVNKIIEIYKEAPPSNPDLRRSIIDQVTLKLVLDCAIIPKYEVDHIITINETLRDKFFDTKQYSKYMLSIDSGRLQLYSIKKKDEIDITKCQIESETRQGLSENNKYQFAITYKSRSLLGLQQSSRLILGTDSDQARRDWIFTLRLFQQCKTQMRESVLYVNQLKKISLFQVTLKEDKSDKRESQKEFMEENIESMKRQAKEVDLPLQYTEGPGIYYEESSESSDEESIACLDGQGEKMTQETLLQLERNPQSADIEVEKVDDDEYLSVHNTDESKSQLNTKYELRSIQEVDSQLQSSLNIHDQADQPLLPQPQIDTCIAANHELIPSNDEPLKPIISRFQQYQQMEYKVIGKTSWHEICGETATNSLIRFIIHFLFFSEEYQPTQPEQGLNRVTIPINSNQFYKAKYSNMHGSPDNTSSKQIMMTNPQNYLQTESHHSRQQSIETLTFTKITHTPQHAVRQHEEDIEGEESNIKIPSHLHRRIASSGRVLMKH